MSTSYIYSSSNYSIKLFTGCTEPFLNAVQEILKDEGFKIGSSQASDALEAASAMVEWSEESTYCK